MILFYGGIVVSYRECIRTDLALELSENVDKQDSRFKGVIVREDVDKDTQIKVTFLEILNKKGEELIGREKGKYITIEAKDIRYNEKEYTDRLINILAEHIKELVVPFVGKQGKILVAGLGNREVTADSLGPFVIDNLDMSRCMAISPGVMAQTGMETAKIIKGVAKESKPAVIIAIDALAARDSKRLNSTIQLCDKGINPGSGVGNHREGVTESNIGVPVVAIGVPTVIDAPTIVYDAIDTFIAALGSVDVFKEVADIMGSYSEEEKYDLAKDVISPAMAQMYVTPKDIDSDVSTIGEVIAAAINQVLDIGA